MGGRVFNAMIPIAPHAPPPIPAPHAHPTTSRMGQECASYVHSPTAPDAQMITYAIPAALHRGSPSTPTTCATCAPTPTASPVLPARHAAAA